jgi:hypothetical protein
MIQFAVNFINGVQGLRKTLVMLLLIAISVIFRSKGLMSGDNMVELLKACTIAFFGVNGIEHLSTAVKEYVNSKGQKVEKEEVDVEDTK